LSFKAQHFELNNLLLNQSIGCFLRLVYTSTKNRPHLGLVATLDRLRVKRDIFLKSRKMYFKKLPTKFKFEVASGCFLSDA